MKEFINKAQNSSRHDKGKPRKDMCGQKADCESTNFANNRFILIPVLAFVDLSWLTYYMSIPRSLINFFQIVNSDAEDKDPFCEKIFLGLLSWT